MIKTKLCVFAIILTAAFLASLGVLIAGSGNIVWAETKTASATASEEIEIMKVKDVKVGMKGIGKTVVHGFEIEEFDVEILGVLKNNKIDDSLQISGSSFLVQVSGEVIEKSGGIAAGMSGSPVYIDGKLAGAVSSGWVMADHSVGLLTPIEEMTGLFKYMKKEKKSGVNVNELIDRDVMLFIDKSPKVASRYKGVKIGAESIEKINENEYMIFEKASTPLMVTGLNNRNFDFLSQSVKRSGYNVKLINAESAPSFSSEDFSVPELKPGHAIAAQLVKGDINITAIGTLTYLKNNRFLAFAHSFLKKGDANYFFTPANIYYCFSSPEMPFKIGAPGQLIGSVTVDRNEGIAGLLGVMPHVINVHTVVRDLDNKLKREFSTHVVDDNAMLADLLQSILTQAIDEGINRQGEGFAKVAYSINGRSEKNGEFKINRKNYFYDEADIASSSINELMSTVRTVVANPFEKACLYDVTVEFDISANNPSAVVSSVSIDKTAYNGGESIEIAVKVEPKYKKSFIENFTIPVP
ncbi:MAG TPA: SpoIVB peptidase S55 domain-containing protein, partial [Candidatus Wallbacteria bacterium]|nr:SpoIVB peptidase S55 domain-containing protein [Candidatus Wallbacteria bacterium]